MAGGNNIVLLLRGQPQFCGWRGYIQEMLLLYMFITLPWKNKRLGHRHFLGSSLPSHLSRPVWEGGSKRLYESWAHVILHHFRNRHPYSSFSFLHIFYHKLLSPAGSCFFTPVQLFASSIVWILGGNTLIYSKCWFSVTLDTWEFIHKYLKGNIWCIYCLDWPLCCSLLVGYNVRPPGRWSLFHCCPEFESGLLLISEIKCDVESWFFRNIFQPSRCCFGFMSSPDCWNKEPRLLKDWKKKFG